MECRWRVVAGPHQVFIYLSYGSRVNSHLCLNSSGSVLPLNHSDLQVAPKVRDPIVPVDDLAELDVAVAEFVDHEEKYRDYYKGLPLGRASRDIVADGDSVRGRLLPQPTNATVDTG